jgi:hypothetical protein
VRRRVLGNAQSARPKRALEKRAHTPFSVRARHVQDPQATVRIAELTEEGPDSLQSQFPLSGRPRE